MNTNDFIDKISRTVNSSTTLSVVEIEEGRFEIHIDSHWFESVVVSPNDELRKSMEAWVGHNLKRRIVYHNLSESFWFEVIGNIHQHPEPLNN